MSVPHVNRGHECDCGQGSQARIIRKNLAIIFIELTRTFDSEGIIFLSSPLHLLIVLVTSLST